MPNAIEREFLPDLPDDRGHGQTPRPDRAKAGMPRDVEGPIDRMIALREGWIPWKRNGGRLDG